MVARIFHLWQLFCCLLPCNLQNTCLVQFFASSSYREMLLEAVRINSTFMCVLWSLQDSELSLLWALAIILTTVSFLLVESLGEMVFFAVEDFSLPFLVQTAKTYLFHLTGFHCLLFLLQSVVSLVKMLLGFRKLRLTIPSWKLTGTPQQLSYPRVGREPGFSYRSSMDFCKVYLRNSHSARQDQFWR